MNTPSPTPADGSVVEALIIEHLPIAEQVAAKVARTLPRTGDLNVDDLAQEAAIGVMDAVRSYDPSSGVPLHAWCKWSARRQVQDLLRHRDPIGRWNREAIAAMDAGTPVTPDRAATLNRLRHLDGYIGSLDRPLPNAEPEWADTIGSVLQDPAPTPEDQVADRDEHERAWERLDAHLADLATRDRTILWLYDGHRLSLGDVGATFGVSESRISQLRSQALKVLRARLGVTPTAA